MNILAQYLYSFTLLFLVQQLACFKCQAQRILTSIQNVCDVVEPSEDHTTSTSINIGDTLSTTQVSFSLNKSHQSHSQHASKTSKLLLILQLTSKNI